jgi:hypothetical protein
MTVTATKQQHTAGRPERGRKPAAPEGDHPHASRAVDPANNSPVIRNPDKAKKRIDAGGIRRAKLAGDGKNLTAMNSPGRATRPVRRRCVVGAMFGRGRGCGRVRGAECHLRTAGGDDQQGLAEGRVHVTLEPSDDRNEKNTGRRSTAGPDPTDV